MRVHCTPEGLGESLELYKCPGGILRADIGGTMYVHGHFGWVLG